MNVKRIALTIVTVLTAALLTACGPAPEEAGEPAVENELPVVTEEMTSAEEEAEPETEAVPETTEEETAAGAEPETDASTEAQADAAATEAAVLQGEYSILGTWRLEEELGEVLMLFRPDGKMTLISELSVSGMEGYLTFENGEIGFAEEYAEADELLVEITRSEDASDFRIYEFTDVTGIYYVLDGEEKLYVMMDGLDLFTYEVGEGTLTTYSVGVGEPETAVLEFLDADTIRLTEETEDGTETMKMTRAAHLDKLADYLN